jgi:hypothetical protein
MPSLSKKRGLKKLAMSGKSPAYIHRRKNQPAAKKSPRAFSI